MDNKNKEQKKEWVYLAVEATLQHEGIAANMARFGYDETRMQEAKNKLGSVRIWDTKHFDHIGMQKKATKDIKSERKQVDKIYIKHLKLARIALEDHSNFWDLLKLEGERHQALPNWLDQVGSFYFNYERVADILASYNITQEEVEQVKAMLEAIQDYRVAQSMSKSHAQEATRQRNKVSRELDEWMQEFMYVAKLALKDNPQYLEALGKIVKGKK